MLYHHRRVVIVVLNYFKAGIVGNCLMILVMLLAVING